MDIITKNDLNKRSVNTSANETEKYASLKELLRSWYACILL